MTQSQILKNYSLPTLVKSKLKKQQDLAIEIIKYYGETEKKWKAMWFVECKRDYVNVFDKFKEAKRDLRPKQYLYRMLHPKK